MKLETFNIIAFFVALIPVIIYYLSSIGFFRFFVNPGVPIASGVIYMILMYLVNGTEIFK